MASAAMVLTLAATSGTGTAAPSRTGTAPGVGSSLAETVKVDPRAGGLSLGITTGRSLSGHQNSVAQASSQAIDLGVIGTTLAAEGCDGSAPSLPADQQPQALQVDSRQQGVSDFKTEGESAVPGGQVLFTKQARATTDPFGEAITTTAPFGVAGAIEYGGGVAHTTSGLVDGVRTATASVDISSINLAGQIAIQGLHWEVSYPSTGDAKPSGSFTIGHITIAGQTVPSQDAASALDNLNAVLNPLGLQLQPPGFVQGPNVAYVEPLRLSVVPNATRDQVFGSVLRGVQPIRQPLFQALLDQKCTLSSEITVFDVALGSISGAGAFNLIFGGVQASSGEAPVNSFILGGGSGLLLSGSNKPTTLSAPSPTLSTGTRPSSTPAAAPAQVAAPAAPKSTGIQQVAASKPKGQRGGALASVGLAGLLLLVAAAEADRRKMRNAQRAITFND